MKRRDFLTASGLVLSGTALASIPNAPLKPLAVESDKEEAHFVREDMLRGERAPYHMYRDHDEITARMQGELVLTMLQSPDGGTTVVQLPNSPIITQILFGIPVFSLPDGTKAYGEIREFNEEELLSRSITMIDVMVDRSWRTYIQQTEWEDFLEITTHMYRPDSRLPLAFEYMLTNKKTNRLTRRVTFTPSKD
jgi:hypothetical protein